MRVETSMPGSLDVVAVGTHQKMLGLDMMHHVAQWGADAWGPDDSAIDLPQLRGDLQSGRAVYLGKGSYSGQDVYRIRTRSGEILLLDMHYMPVMVLSSSGKPMYDILKMLPASQVPAYMWNTTIPPGWKMGTLPPPPGR